MLPAKAPVLNDSQKQSIYLILHEVHLEDNHYRLGSIASSLQATGYHILTKKFGVQGSDTANLKTQSCCHGSHTPLRHGHTAGGESPARFKTVNLFQRWD